MGPRGGLITESPESLELWLEVSESNERLEASSLCRCAQRLRPINLPEFAGVISESTERLEASALCWCAQRLLPINQPEFAGEFFGTEDGEDSVRF